MRKADTERRKERDDEVPAAGVLGRREDGRSDRAGPTDTQEEESFPWFDDLQARGIWVTGDQLAPPRRARSVRVRDGKKMVTDGPFTETKEAVGGFDILECGSLDEAVEIAAAHPIAQMGTIEVRPLWGN